MKTRVWNRDFVLLWQGQLVSSIGDVAFQIGLGFWILSETGSSAVMGTVLALSTLVRVLLGPAGGVFADRWNRKLVIVFADILRGVVVTVGAILAYLGYLDVWMVMIGAALIGVAAAFFEPAVGASIPDLVPKDNLVKGNSAFALIQTFAGILGNTLGGLLYTFIGAPLLFLINGITYFLSSISESFMNIPSHREEGPKPQEGDSPEEPRSKTGFRDELREGLSFVWKQPVLRLLLINVGMLNLFLTMGGVLLVPYFERSEVFAATDYGLTMAFMTGGSLLALLLLQIVNIPRRSRFAIFAVSAIAFGIARSFLVSIPALPVIVPLAVVAGLSVALLNSFIISTIQEIVPAQLRGKVLGLLGTFSGGLMPLGMAAGGILGDIFPITTIIPITGLLATIGFIPLIVSPRVATMLNSEPAETTQASGGFP